MTSPRSERHTPGPWYAERCGVTPCYHVEAGAFPLGSTICEVEESPKQGSAEANARLIASAPDLLDCLRFAVERSKAIRGNTRPEGAKWTPEEVRRSWAALEAMMIVAISKSEAKS